MNYETVNEKLFAEFPSFLLVLKEWDALEDLDSQYYIAGRFVDFLKLAYKKGDRNTYERGLDFIEKLHLSDCLIIGELATVGYLESFPDWDKKDVLINDLGEVSKKWWLELNRFWEERIAFISQSFFD